MDPYHHLNLDERSRLYQLVEAGWSARRIAITLGRHPSTVLSTAL